MKTVHLDREFWNAAAVVFFIVVLLFL